MSTLKYNPLTILNMSDETERSPLLRHAGGNQAAQLHQNSGSMNKDPETTAEEIKMADTAVGERLKYNDYTTIDWLHDLVHLLTYVDRRFQKMYSRMCVGQGLESHALCPQSQRYTLSLVGNLR